MSKQKSFGKYLRSKRKESQKSQRMLAQNPGSTSPTSAKWRTTCPAREPLRADSDQAGRRARSRPRRDDHAPGKSPSDVKNMLVDDFSLIKEIRQRKRSEDDSDGGSS